METNKILQACRKAMSTGFDRVIRSALIAGLFGGALGAVGVAQTADDDIWQPPVPITCVNSVTSVNPALLWTNPGLIQPGGCAMPVFGADGTVDTNKISVLSYGTTSGTRPGWQMHLSSGIAVRPCNSPGGRQDGSPDCIVYEYQMPEVAEWRPCANEGGVCAITGLLPNQYKIARYGAGTRWAYQLVASSVNCSVNDFNGTSFDPVGGVAKTCQVSSNAFSTPVAKAWTRCATGGVAEVENRCTFPESGTYLVRFARPVDQNYKVPYRLVSGTGFQCWPSNFDARSRFLQTTSEGVGEPDWQTARNFSVGSFCEYLPLAEVQQVFGKWELVGMCEDCADNIEYMVSVGVEKGKSKESSKTFGLEVSQTISIGGEVFGSETSFTASSETSELIAESFTRSEGSEFTISCGKGALYQWVTGVRSFCTPSGPKLNPEDCETIAKSKMFRCVEPSEHPGYQPVRVGVKRSSESGAAGSAPVPVQTTPPPSATTPAIPPPRPAPSPALTPGAAPISNQQALISCTQSWQRIAGAQGTPGAPRTVVLNRLGSSFARSLSEVSGGGPQILRNDFLQWCRSGDTSTSVKNALGN
jgi:hypothetical protein